MTDSDPDHDLRDQLVRQLKGENAHISFKRAVEGIPFGKVGIRPGELPYSIWEQAEHLRIAQEDIVQFSTEPNYESPSWPEGYWPESRSPGSEEEWTESLKAIDRDLQEMIDLVQDSKNDLFKPFPWGDGQTLCREAILIIDHNSYHTGQIIVLKRLLGLHK